MSVSIGPGHGRGHGDFEHHHEVHHRGHRGPSPLAIAGTGLAVAAGAGLVAAALRPRQPVVVTQPVLVPVEQPRAPQAYVYQPVGLVPQQASVATMDY